jgi:endoglucanase
LELSWAYWDFGSDFGAYDVAANAWREPLRAALLGD